MSQAFQDKLSEAIPGAERLISISAVKTELVWRMLTQMPMTRCDCCEGEGWHKEFVQFLGINFLSIRGCDACAGTGRVPYLCFN